MKNARFPLLVLFLLAGCSLGSCLVAGELSATSSTFGKMPSGEEVKQFTLTNRSGMEVKLIEYGATITSLRVADRNGKFANVVLGSDSLEAYLRGFPAASVTGRYANRISGAQFTLDNQVFRVTKNAGPNHIHGGQKNFAKVRWSGTAQVQDGVAKATFQFTSPDGDEGFPGKLAVVVSYSLSEDNQLTIQYGASTDKPTVVNLTNHAYFNLSGTPSNVLNHRLQIFAEMYTVADKALIPTGEFASVAGTPLDFQMPHTIGERIESLYSSTQGYDHNFVLDGRVGALLKAAHVEDPESGRVMDCSTTEPGMQLYTANGFNGNPYPKHGAFCLETQHYPDSPNQPNFPTTVVRPGDTWTSTTIYKFSTLGDGTLKVP